MWCEMQYTCTHNLAAVAIWVEHISLRAVADKRAWDVLAKLTARVKAIVSTLVNVHTVRPICLKLKPWPTTTFLKNGIDKLTIRLLHEMTMPVKTISL